MIVMKPQYHVWRVNYDKVFTSSSGSKPYSVDHPNKEGLFLTVDDSLKAVVDEVAACLSSQEYLAKINTATFLGKVSRP